MKKTKFLNSILFSLLFLGSSTLLNGMLPKHELKKLDELYKKYLQDEKKELKRLDEIVCTQLSPLQKVGMGLGSILLAFSGGLSFSGLIDSYAPDIPVNWKFEKIRISTMFTSGLLGLGFIWLSDPGKKVTKKDRKLCFQKKLSKKETCEI
ncbi:hypothetical protein ACFLYU_01160 [Candidatus Dependentiae bacterium]